MANSANPPAPGKSAAKVGRPSRSVDEEIAAMEERLRALKAKKRDDERREAERNEKAIIATIKAAGLLSLPHAVWEAKLPKVLKAFEGQTFAQFSATEDAREAAGSADKSTPSPATA